MFPSVTNSLILSSVQMCCQSNYSKEACVTYWGGGINIFLHRSGSLPLANWSPKTCTSSLADAVQGEKGYYLEGLSTSAMCHACHPPALPVSPHSSLLADLSPLVDALCLAAAQRDSPASLPAFQKCTTLSTF